LASAPAILDIEQMLVQWSDEEVNAFFCCVQSAGDSVPVTRHAAIRASIDKLFWSYNSKTFATAKRTKAQATAGTYQLLPENMKGRLPRPESVHELHEYATPVGYEFLLRECCKKLDIGKWSVDPVAFLEIYLYEKVIVQALSAMSAEQRHGFLTQSIDTHTIYAATFDASTEVAPGGLAGPGTTLTALAAAQASGFGVYLGATTALGFVSHAVGVTLPFAAYTGMTSTISFLIGPAGFLAGATWLAIVLTSPEWSRIIRALLHVMIMKAKYDYRNKHLVLRQSTIAGLVT
jgi:hypothetical protein